MSNDNSPLLAICSAVSISRSLFQKFPNELQTMASKNKWWIDSQASIEDRVSLEIINKTSAIYAQCLVLSSKDLDKFYQDYSSSFNFSDFYKTLQIGDGDSISIYPPQTHQLVNSEQMQIITVLNRYIHATTPISEYPNLRFLKGTKE